MTCDKNMYRLRRESYQLASVDDVLRVGETTGTGSTDNRVVTRWSVSHTHCAELEERFADRHTAEEHLTVAGVARTILV